MTSKRREALHSAPAPADLLCRGHSSTGKSLHSAAAAYGAFAMPGSATVPCGVSELADSAEDLTATARSKVPVGGQAGQPAPSSALLNSSVGLSLKRSATHDQKSSLPSLKVAAPQGQSATMHQSNSLPSLVKMPLPPGPVPAAGGSGDGKG